MRKVPVISLSATLLALCLAAPLQAQNQTSTVPDVNGAAPAPAPAPAPAGQAPEEATNKITDLVHAGKYAEAKQLVAGLLIAYPDDQRLTKAKDLIDKLIAAPNAASATKGSQQGYWSLNGDAGHLTDADKLEYSTLMELARQSQQSNNPDDQFRLLMRFMRQSADFLKRHPDQMVLWQLRAVAAIGLVDPRDGFEAGQKLLAAGAMERNDPALQQLLAKLNLLGWMDKDKVEDLQRKADEAREQQAAAAEADRQNVERAKYTFPVAHADALHYGYGHITFDADGALYVGSDGTIRMLRSDMREVKSACASWICGLYFKPKRGKNYFMVAVTEDAVTSRQIQTNVMLPPYVLGNAVIAKWKFVASANNKKLTPQ